MGPIKLIVSDLHAVLHLIACGIILLRCAKVILRVHSCENYSNIFDINFLAKGPIEYVEYCLTVILVAVFDLVLLGFAIFAAFFCFFFFN